MINESVNSPDTSSAGRLFDALASLLGLCDTAAWQAEAPVLLEQCAADDFSDAYTIDPGESVISLDAFFREVLKDLEQGIPAAVMAAKIHNGLARLILEKSRLLLAQTGAARVVVSGGCFQNRRLTEQIRSLFLDNGIPLYVPSKIPCNDGGISAGQIAVAAARK